jgi:type III restriction enzyme
MLLMIDNYHQTGAVVHYQTVDFAHHVRINMFNISTINYEVPGGQA